MPVSTGSVHFMLRVPVDPRRPAGEFKDVRVATYLEAQRVRAHAVACLALGYMGLDPAALSPDEGGTIDQLMARALGQAEPGADRDSPLPFWRVQLGSPTEGE